MALKSNSISGDSFSIWLSAVRCTLLKPTYFFSSAILSSVGSLSSVIFCLPNPQAFTNTPTGQTNLHFLAIFAERLQKPS